MPAQKTSPKRRAPTGGAPAILHNAKARGEWKMRNFPLFRPYFKFCGSGSVSRVLSPRSPGRVIIPLARALLPGSSDLPGGLGRATLKRPSIRSCSGWGLPCRPCHQGRGELLPRLFTLTPRGGAVCFLWHFPWGRPRSPLATTLPCGARTFLPPSAGDHPTPFRKQFSHLAI